MTVGTETDVTIARWWPNYEIIFVIETIIVNVLQIFEVLSEKLNVGRNSKIMMLHP